MAHSARATEASTSRDLIRQIAVISAASFMLIAAMVGVGLFGGTAVQDLQDGALDADASYLAPAQQAFSIWSVIYVGLILYTIWQALPGQRANPRQRELGWWIALTMVLNGLWLVIAQFGTLLLTMIGILVLLAALALTFRRAVRTRTPDDKIIDALLIDGVTGLHLGWVTVASVANITAFLTVNAPEGWADAATPVGIVVLLVVAVIGLAIAWISGWRIAPGLALAWGLCWLAVGRLSGEPHSTGIGITAIIVAVVVLVPALLVSGLRILRPSGD